MTGFSSIPLSKSIYVKLVTLLMLVSGISVLITSIVLSAYELERMETAEERRLRSIAEILQPNLTASILFEDISAATELIEPLMNQSSITHAVVFDKNNNKFVSISKRNEKNSGVRSSAQRTISLPLVLDGVNHGWLEIYADNSNHAEHIRFYSIFLGVITLLILAMCLIVSIWLGRRFVKPILDLASIANRVTNTNDYSLRAEASGTDELGDLALCFNNMMEQISERDQTLELKVEQRTVELNIVNQKLHSQAYKDSLSGLPNRRHTYELINNLIQTLPEGNTFALLFIDLDGFKDVNDTMGHDFGDMLIIAVAQRLKQAININDTIARLGGDEFTIIANDWTDKTKLSQFVEGIHQELSEPFIISGERILVSASIGISTYPDNARSCEELMKNADLAMYQAKAEGRDGYCFFKDEMLERIQKKRQMLDDLRVAIAEQQLELYLQPIIALDSGKIEKAEALIRWHHPVNGLVSPGEFIPLAEESGLINDIGLWVANRSIEIISNIRRNYDPDFCLGFNVSPIQLKSGSKWLNKFTEALFRTSLGENALLIEITENVLIQSDSKALHRLMSMKDLGVNVAIDDFGVGYSSLSYLQQFKVHTLKIDRSFIDKLDADFASETLCNTMIKMAKNLGIQVVAEGVETPIHAAKLNTMGCDYVQGFCITSQ
ncbi:EAL domain-containing protein [Vibrio hannami]|uniref:bifunctional diguanylate cyclase/phosphodiesterase n=1 Tax=Vibrio hannami TaxID=2717094 RepID=UPI00240F8B18|nr:EAL domain-containing protein [Vibrio hannami]MDG3085761.1 EAL domain-containing protein [Vibrio hannami]